MLMSAVTRVAHLSSFLPKHKVLVSVVQGCGDY